jgi:hypothetical protein
MPHGSNGPTITVLGILIQNTFSFDVARYCAMMKFNEISRIDIA